MVTPIFLWMLIYVKFTNNVGKETYEDGTVGLFFQLFFDKICCKNFPRSKNTAFIFYRNAAIKHSKRYKEQLCNYCLLICNF